MTAEVVTIVTDVNNPSVVDTAEKTERPAWLPEKFKTAEELAASYVELEKKLGKPADQKTPEDPPADPPATDQAVAEATAALAEKGLDYAKLQDEFLKDGKLSDDTLADLEKRGIPRAAVDDFVAARVEQATSERAFALDGVGEEKFGAVVAWAKTNLPAADIETFNTSITSAKSKEGLKAAVANLVARYEQVNGSEPALINLNGSPASGDVYQSVAQMQADMLNPKYDKDPAFRASVATKLARSQIM
jgi:hypothetical protein